MMSSTTEQQADLPEVVTLLDASIVTVRNVKSKKTGEYNRREYIGIMIKYRIVYLGDDRYLAWDADNKRFVPAGMHLYITTYASLEDAMQEMRKVRKSCSGWASNIYLDSVLRDSLGECRPDVK